MTFDEMMAELQKEYVESLPEKVATIKAHWESGDMETLTDDFHKLKGTGKTYGLPEVSELALLMEKSCRERSDNIPNLLPIAISLLERIHEKRSQGQAVDLSSEPEFQKMK